MEDIGGTRTERVVLETARHRITGDVTLPREGYANRISDLLNREGLSFILLTDAIVADLNGNTAPEQVDFIAVARHHVQIAYEG